MFPNEINPGRNVSNPLLSKAWASPCETPAAKTVLARLADMANDSGECWPSIQRLSADCGLNERTIRRAIRSCEKSGYLATKATGRTSLYRILIGHNAPSEPKDTMPDQAGHIAPSERTLTAETPGIMPPKPSVTLREPSITQSELLPPEPKPKPKAPTSEQIEAIYQAYPRKVGKDAAIKAIRKALLTGGVSYDDLLRKVQIYAGCRAGQDTQYTPYPQKWFNEKRWQDDPASLREAGKPQTNGKPYVKSLQEKESERIARIAESGSAFYG